MDLPEGFESLYLPFPLAPVFREVSSPNKLRIDGFAGSRLFYFVFFPVFTEHIFRLPHNLILFDQAANVAGGWKFNGIFRADGCTGGAAYHAHLRHNHNRPVLLIIESIYASPATGCANSAADTAIGYYGGVSLDLRAGNSMPKTIILVAHYNLLDEG